MNQLYPIIRRVRRPLLPIEEPRSSRREEAQIQKAEVNGQKSEVSQSLVTSAAAGASETPPAPPAAPVSANESLLFAEAENAASTAAIPGPEAKFSKRKPNATPSPK